MTQLSYPYMTTGKTIALTMWTFISKLMSLLFNILSRVCHSFPSKEQVSFNFMAEVILEPKKIKSVTAYSWLNYKYKIFHIAVEVYHKTPGQECSQTSRKFYESFAELFFLSISFLCEFFFLSANRFVLESA